VAAKFADYFYNVTVNAIVGQQTLIKSLTFTDYSRITKNNTCQANIVFDKSSLIAVALYLSWVVIAADPKLNAMFDAGLTKNDEAVLNKMISIANGAVPLAVQNYRSDVLFTIEPTGSTGSNLGAVVSFRPADVLLLDVSNRRQYSEPHHRSREKNASGEDRGTVTMAAEGAEGQANIRITQRYIESIRMLRF
jgi:hypothetical protein